MRRLSLLLAFLLVPLPLAGQTRSSSVSAFPGAWGWGASALQNCATKPVKVRFVTNTNNSGTGSARQAIQVDADPDTMDFVIFRTGGSTITTGPIDVVDDCLYIAGQTAPGGGWQLRHNDGSSGTGFSYLRQGPDDVVLRYVRLRMGYFCTVRPDGTCDYIGDGIGLNGGRRNIIDHVSVWWTNDEGTGIQTNSSGGVPQHDITIQNSIYAAGNRPHSTGIAVGGAPGDGLPIQSRMSFIRNFHSHMAQRNPRFAHRDSLEAINNYVYAWNARVGEDRYQIMADFINNYWEAGPIGNTNVCRLYDERSEAAGIFPIIYASGNICHPNHTNPAAPQVNLWTWMFGSAQVKPADPSWFIASPINSPTFAAPLLTASQARDTAIATAGASMRLDCDGTWIDNRDSLDELLATHSINGTSQYGSTWPGITGQSDWGGHITLASGTACPDTDNDGMFDEWELTQVSNIAGLDTDDVHNGRWAIEWFLAGYGLDGQPLDGGEEPPPDPPASRRRYWLRALTCVAVSAFDYCQPDLSGTDGSNRVAAFLNAARDSAIIVTTNTDSLTVGAGPLEDAEVTALCAEDSWLCTFEHLSTMLIPGEE